MIGISAENTNTRRRYGGDVPFVGQIAKRALVEALAVAIQERGLDLNDEAVFLGAPTHNLEEIIEGGPVAVSLETLVTWLMALGHPIEIRLGTRDTIKEGPLTITKL